MGEAKCGVVGVGGGGDIDPSPYSFFDIYWISFVAKSSLFLFLEDQRFRPASKFHSIRYSGLVTVSADAPGGGEGQTTRRDLVPISPSLSSALRLVPEHLNTSTPHPLIQRLAARIKRLLAFALALALALALAPAFSAAALPMEGSLRRRKHACLVRGSQDAPYKRLTCHADQPLV